jgi:hypothetical protein
VRSSGKVNNRYALSRDRIERIAMMTEDWECDRLLNVFLNTEVWIKREVLSWLRPHHEISENKHRSTCFF